MLRSIHSTNPVVDVRNSVRGFVVIDRQHESASSSLAYLAARLRHRCTCVQTWLAAKWPMRQAAPAFVRTS
jgi:hypothetical protein